MFGINGRLDQIESRLHHLLLKFSKVEEIAIQKDKEVSNEDIFVAIEGLYDKISELNKSISKIDPKPVIKKSLKRIRKTET
jgi:hypothetical protein